MKGVNATNRHGSQPPSVTGRDGYLLAQAFAYAITAIELRPKRWQEWSNKEGMKLLLDHLVPNPYAKEHLLEGAKFHLTGTDHPTIVVGDATAV